MINEVLNVIHEFFLRPFHFEKCELTLSYIDY